MPPPPSFSATFPRAGGDAPLRVDAGTRERGPAAGRARGAPETRTAAMADIFSQISEVAEQEKASLASFKSIAEGELRRSRRAKEQKQEFDDAFETRILLNAVVSAVNRLPEHAELEEARADSAKVAKLLDKLAAGMRAVQRDVDAALDVQLEHLVRSRKVDADAVRAGKRKRSGGSGGDPGWGDCEAKLRAMEGHWSRTIEEWRGKTRVTKQSSSFRVVDQSIFRQVEALMEDPARVKRRAFRTREEAARQRVRRDGVAAPEGGAADDAEEADEEVYDDAAFYQMLLRDFTDAANSGNGQAAGVKLQRKVNKNVDRKASKGRKVRYNLHPKLENFMYPEATEDPDGLDVDRLFSSLLGVASGAQG